MFECRPPANCLAFVCDGALLVADEAHIGAFTRWVLPARALNAASSLSYQPTGRSSDEQSVNATASAPPSITEQIETLGKHVLQQVSLCISVFTYMMIGR